MPPFILLFILMGITTWLYAEAQFSGNGSTVVRLASFTVSYFALMGFCFSNLQPLIMLPFFAVNALLLHQCYACSTKTALIHSAFLTFGMIITQELASLKSGTSFWDLNHMDFAVFPWQLYYLAVCVLGVRLLKPPGQELRISPMTMILSLSPILSGGVVMALTLQRQEQPLEPRAESMVTVLEASLLGVNLLLFALHNHLEKAHAEKLELELSMQKEQSDAKYYQSLQKQWEDQRILLHDIKNHLHTLDTLAQHEDSPGIRTYLNKLEVSLGTASGPRLTTEPVLDALLRRTVEECRQKGLTFHCDIREGCTDFMDAPSITALYGNLLSNAMEGAQRSQGRTLELRVTQSPQGVVVSLVNDCDTPPRKDFRTSKENAVVHGIGMKSIARVISRYHGIQTVYYDEKHRQFHHVIHFSKL